MPNDVTFAEITKTVLCTEKVAKSRLPLRKIHVIIKIRQTNGFAITYKVVRRKYSLLPFMSRTI